MKRIAELCGVFVPAFLASSLFFVAMPSNELFGQEADVAESMGVGKQSRFASGATPITIQRTQIVPGTPMSVNSTMNNILTSNSGSSFGGILARYDTANFGKFFGTGTLSARNTLTSNRVDALTNLDQGDNEIENVESDRMYPAVLVLDFKEFPTHLAANSSEILAFERRNVTSQVENVLSRCDFDRRNENVIVEIQDGVVYLRGKVKSGRTARLLKNVLEINFGGESVISEIVVLEPETSNVDLFGRPSR